MQKPVLQNERVALTFDATTGALLTLHNKLNGEVYELAGERFTVVAEEFRVDQTAAKLVGLRIARGSMRARYTSGPLQVEVDYTLGRGHCFAEKHLTLTCEQDCGLERVIVSAATLSAPGLEVVCYRYPKFGRAPGDEPVRTYFGRTPSAGFYTGLEVAFDRSSLERNHVELGYAPSLRLRAGETLACEPAYFGVYRRAADDLTRPSPRTLGALSVDPAEVLPLPSESAAMVAMTSAILGPPRHGLVPMACGWHCEMQQQAYASDEDVEADMRSLDCLAECGIDWVSDSHPWGGETEKMNALGEDDQYGIGGRVRRFLEHARRRGVNVVMWGSMNNTHHWSPLGRPFRPDKPEWLLSVPDPAGKPDLIRNAKANCFANRPFFAWVSRLNLEGLDSGLYGGWAMDGSFYGDGGWYTSIIPVECASTEHDHLPGDANYPCQRALDRLIARVRQHDPNTLIFTCRPPMDLGVWSLRNVDVCFTLLESGTGTSNLEAGDLIRTWSRVRVQRDFLPHYLDQPLLFPSRADRSAPPNWPSGHLDYILLSALSSSPNQLFYLPTKTGLPEADKREIRTWLDWGRANTKYLQVRRDLPEWPSPGTVDGSAHLINGRGLIFLFNSGQEPAIGEFTLDEAGIGLQPKGRFEISQEHPASDLTRHASYGETVRWEVPAESPVVLRIARGSRR